MSVNPSRLRVVATSMVVIVNFVAFGMIAVFFFLEEDAC